MANTARQGNAFRDVVAALLRTQFEDVATEREIAGTAIDITFSKLEFGSWKRFAVECKDYDRPLTKGYISKNIKSVYDPMFEQGPKESIHHVLIVSKHPLAPAARSYVDSIPRYSHQTYDQFSESILGIRRYVEGIARLVDPAQAAEYVAARFVEDQCDAMALIEKWIEDSGPPGLAVLGGYGQGKTCFAQQVAARAAVRHLADPVHRVPLFLRLGEVVHETRLENLFGGEFTSRHHVPGYHFETLMHLAKTGRLLIVLDGFDEMKHAMTAADFYANFKEFNRLLVPGGKVLLLGRPSSLPSDSMELVFRGNRRFGDSYVADPAFQAWQERRLDFFTLQEATTLLGLHLKSVMSKYESERAVQYPDGYFARRIKEIAALVPFELLRRPVHVTLIAEVAADANFSFEGFNEFRLYQRFIEKMVERDTVDKPARREIALEHRLSFQRELAWWAWKRIGVAQGIFNREDVPAAILDGLPAGKSVDVEGKRNEYIVSTLTEAKDGGMLFFAHRSFQEFLVAERMTTTPVGPSAHPEYSRFFNAEIGDFLMGSPNQQFSLDWVESLGATNGPLSLGYLNFFATQPSFREWVTSSFKRLPSTLGKPALTAILMLAYADDAPDPERPALPDATQIRAWFLDNIVNAKDARVVAFSIIGLLAKYSAGSTAGVERLISAIIMRTLQRDIASEEDRKMADTVTVATDAEDFLTGWLSRELRRETAESGAKSLVFSVNRLCTIAFNSLESAGFLNVDGAKSDVRDSLQRIVAKITVDLKLEIGSVMKHIPNQLVGKHRSFLYSNFPTFKVVTKVVRASQSSKPAEASARHRLTLRS